MRQTAATEIVAANFSLLAIVAAPEPAPDYELIDRLLCAAAGSGADALLVWNKIDLIRRKPARLREYEAAGFRVLAVSALKGTRLGRLRRQLKAHRSVLAGQSGGGKSTLVNALLGRAVAAAGKLSDKARAGPPQRPRRRRCTRCRAAAASWTSLAFRSLMPALTDYSGLAAGYPEFAGPAQKCRFANCPPPATSRDAPSWMRSPPAASPQDATPAISPCYANSNNSAPLK